MKSASVELSGRVKWFDGKRGYGFVVASDGSGDVLVHRSILLEYGVRGVPEGATLCVVAHKSKRGMQAEKVLSIDTSTAQPTRATEQPHGEPGDFEPVEVKWFDPNRGYGFLIRHDDDVFIHAQVVDAAGLKGLFHDGDTVEARIAQGPKGLIATHVRPAAAAALAA